MNANNIELMPFYKALADETRLKALLLILLEEELCVCELMVALGENSQPKVSRHLAQMRNINLLAARKERQWVFYSINPEIAPWLKDVISSTLHHNPTFIGTELSNLRTMGGRPERMSACC